MSGEMVKNYLLCKLFEKLVKWKTEGPVQSLSGDGGNEVSVTEGELTLLNLSKYGREEPTELFSAKQQMIIWSIFIIGFHLLSDYLILFTAQFVEEWLVWNSSHSQNWTLEYFKISLLQVTHREWLACTSG